MNGKKNGMKGRFPEAADARTGNDVPRDKGQADQTFGQVKKTDQSLGHVKQISRKVIAKGSKRMHS